MMLSHDHALPSENWFSTITFAALLLYALLFSDYGFTSQILVTKYTDSADGICDADCSLREAIGQANQSPDHNTIILKPGIYISSIPYDSWPLENTNNEGDFDILNPLTIIGSKRGETVVGKFEINSDNVTFIRLTNRGNESDRLSTDGRESAVNNRGRLILNRCIVSSNKAHWGGGIFNHGTMLLKRTVIRNNIAGSEEEDDGFTEEYAGRGGGIYNAGLLIARESSIESNQAIYFLSFGAGLFNSGHADIRRSFFYKNNHNQLDYEQYSGTAIYNAGNAFLRLFNSTVSNNGMGQCFDWPICYGAIAGAGTVRIHSSTIIESSSGVIAPPGKTSIVNSIIQAGCVGNATCDNVINTAGLSQDNIFTHLLFPLEPVSALTKAYRPRVDSMAIDAGQSPCPRHDQARTTGPLDGNGNGVAECDIGAVEYSGL